MDTKDLAAAESRIKTRLANKLAIEAEDRGLSVDDIASLCGIGVEAAQKLLDNDTADLSLIFIVACLTAIGLNVQFSTAKSQGDRGQILYDLDDA
jgi:hypothetical protein